MSVGFTKYGNRHLYSDVNIKKRTRKIKDSDLPVMDKTLSQAKFIRKQGSTNHVQTKSRDSIIMRENK